MINIEASGSDIITWSRDSEDKFKVIKKKVADFKPYFYVPDESGNYISCFGEKVKKVFTRLPGDVPKERTMYDRHFEADILYCHRFMVDTSEGELKKQEIRVCFLDIETESGENAKQKFPDVDNPENKILSICVYDSFTEKYKIFCLSEEIEFEECEIEFFLDEKEMLKSFCKYIKKNDFDLLSGYNCDKFDLYYIINRMKKLYLNMTILSRDNVKSYIDDYGHIKIWGRNTYDIYFGLRDLKPGERPSWKLGDVSQDELGYGKTDYDGELWELWEKDRKKFLSYNKNDVKLCVDLDKKFSMIDFHDEIRRISKVTWDNVFTIYMVNDCLLLQYCKDRYVLPSIPKRKKESYSGAYTEVFDTGVFDDVIVMDFKSLYPTVMLLYNVSFETVSNKFTDIPIGNNVYFKKDKLGIIPELLYDLYKKRMNYRDLMIKNKKNNDLYNIYKVKQNAYKILMNSRYGEFGFVRSRIYNLKCADSITFMARKIIKKTVEISEKLGLKVLYCHTDSIYFVFDDDKKRDKKELEKSGKELSKKIEREVRKILPENDLVSDITLDLEFESICPSAFFNKKVKARNAKLIIYEDNHFLEKEKLKITGFQSIRSDTPRLIQDLLNEVFVMILNHKSEIEVTKHIKGFESKFLSGKFSIDEISVPIGIRVNVPQSIVKGLSYHVKGAVNMNNHFQGNISKGDKVKVVYLKDWSFDVISYKEKFPGRLIDNIDYKKMWKRYKQVFLDIFECLSWNTLKTGSQSLDKFFSKKMSNVSKSGSKVGLFKFGK